MDNGADWNPYIWENLIITVKLNQNEYINCYNFNIHFMEFTVAAKTKFSIAKPIQI